MANVDDHLITTARLLDVKRSKRLAGEPTPDAPPEALAPNPEVACVCCGYSQQGHHLDRCPECGLVFASRLIDSTPWNDGISRLLGWWETCRRIWLWDRRTRIRTAMLPTTPVSWSFAKWCMGFSAILIGLSLSTLSQNAKATGLLALAHFVLQSLVGTLLAGSFLLAAIAGLSVALRGKWRHRLRFTPSSLHYATAWWPPLSLLMLLAALLCQVGDGRDGEAFMAFLAFLSIATWAGWLWGSITEFPSVRHVELRMAAVLAVLVVIAGALLSALPGSSRIIMVNLVNRTGTSLQRLNVLGTYASKPNTRGPQTYALLLDMIAGDDEKLVETRIRQLGAAEPVWIRRAQCTLDQIEKAIVAANAELRSEDRFILYINGHGAQYGSGSIQMADGELTSQKLTDLLTRFSTTHCLVVIDSCFGGKFIPALGESCSAVVVTSTDNRNIAFQAHLTPFWRALGEAASDSNGDGRVTVNEAFWAAFRTILSQSEKARKADLEQIPGDSGLARMLIQAGYSTPQLESVGKAAKDDFAIPLQATTKPAPK